jgi:hypothetical protein
MKTPRQQSAFTGAAGVYAVASRLSLMNHTVYIPSVDEGVDIMLGNGLRLQVKCGRYHNDPRTSGRYHILAPGRVKKYHKGENRDVRRSYAGVVDFVIYWAIEENRFFVFPAAALTSGVWIPSKIDTFKNLAKKTKTFSAPLIREFEEAWHLLDVDAQVEATETESFIAVEGK